MTLLAALVGGGVATIGTVLLAMSMRRARTRVRRREPGPRSASGSRPPARPATARPLPPPAVRPQDARPRAPKGPSPAGHRPIVPVTEALGGETLQLGTLPAWQVPVTSPNAGAPAARGASGVRRRGEYTSASATGGPDGEAPDARPAPGAPEGRNHRDRGGPSVAMNSSRRHDPRTAAGRTPAR